VSGLPSLTTRRGQAVEESRIWISACTTRLDPGEKGEKIGPLIGRLEQLAALGISEAHGYVPGMWEITPLELLGREVVPAAAKL
jgi:hypothetical protein